MATPDPEAVPAGPPLQALLALQDLDIAISQLDHRRQVLPEREELARTRAALDGVRARLAELTAAKADLAGRQSALDQQAAATAHRRETLEQRLYAARGSAPRDLAAMDEEIRHLAARQGEMEDAELELMVAQEPIDAELAAVHDRVAELDRQAAAQAEALGAVESVLDRELAERRASRTEVAGVLPADLLDRYERLRARLGGVGAARLVGNRCTGCHLELPSMEVDRIRHLPPGAVVTCEQCGRILVPAPAADG